MSKRSGLARRASIACCLFVVSGAAFSAPVTGHDKASGDAASVAQQPPAVPDEIIVRERTRRLLLDETARATEDFYMLLNKVLDNKDYEITCDTETRRGSRIPERVCRTHFQERVSALFAVTTELNGEINTDGNSYLYLYDPSAQLLAAKLQFQNAVLKAVNSNVELNRSVQRLMALKQAAQEYESPRQRLRHEKNR